VLLEKHITMVTLTRPFRRGGGGDDDGVLTGGGVHIQARDYHPPL